MRNFLISKIEAILLYMDRVEEGRPRLSRLTVYPALALVLFRGKIDPYQAPVDVDYQGDDLHVEQIGPLTLMESPGGGYGLYYSNFDQVSDYILDAGGQGGGYSWESLVKAVLEREGINTEALTFDPEGDLFAVYCHDDETLREVAAMIVDLVEDRERLDQAITYAKDRGTFE